MNEAVERQEHFPADRWGDRVPEEVYSLVVKLIAKAGGDDVEMYRVMDALQKSWPAL